jgi:hypothetical protein
VGLVKIVLGTSCGLWLENEALPSSFPPLFLFLVLIFLPLYQKEKKRK